ncbi:glycosyltransferase family 62 protein [Chaetomium sp. MPI-SDFR-AT-0129]|uniref:Glycosyltransferase n=1 Tax=Dichotomopilus funicola TaxID=1934379 RepID=A0AAN6V928_9PEZI|nr:glycosyltransferase family 62 protein [Chaetomium sp. MPI-SDFR-AT-0129]KAK4146704.1 glycosyltransferase [Dichotomopilus funicola]
MLPFVSPEPQVTPRHPVGGYSNGYPRGKTFDILPHRYQPRGTIPTTRRRTQSLLRIGAVAAILFLILLYTLLREPSSPSSTTTSTSSTLSLFSLGLLSSSGSADFQLETVRYHDLSSVQGTARGWEREERILICVPLRDAEAHLSMFFSHLHNLTYPHHLLDLAFLVSDSKDNTLGLLTESLEALQAHEQESMHYGEISIIEKDFGQVVNQDVESRHGFAAQAGRRKLMARARNWLLSAALRPYHSWVYWRDVDVETAPFTILEDLMRHNKDIIVPNVWRPLPEWLGGEQPYDLNSWQESDTALTLADTLDEDAVIVEGYAEYATYRPHLAYLRDPYGDPDVEMELDGVGGVSILAKAKVFRYGVHFPAFSFEKHAETEGFGKMARRMDLSVIGLPHYTIWHAYEPSVDDIKHMEQMKREQLAQEQAEREKAERAMKIKESFSDAAGQWEKDKVGMQNIAQEDQKQKAPAGDPVEAVSGDNAAVSQSKGAAQPAGGKVEEKVVA